MRRTRTEARKVVEEEEKGAIAAEEGTKGMEMRAAEGEQPRSCAPPPILQ